MKKTLTIIIAASGLFAASSVIAAPISHASDNVYAGFWQLDGNGDLAANYVAAIGLRSTLGSQAQGTILADLGSDLNTVFGSGWYNNSSDTTKVYWGVFSWNSASAATNYFVGLNETGNNDTSIDINGVIKENLQASLGSANSAYSAFTGAYENLRVDSYASGTGPLSVGVGMTGDANSFAAKILAATPWSVGGFNLANLSAWVGDQANEGKAGDLWVWGVTKKINAGDTVNNSTQITQGMLTIESNGQVLVVPEPSTYALLGMGLLLMVVAYRRKVSA